MKAWNISAEGLTDELNLGKDMTLRQLAADGIISDEQSVQLSKEYMIVAVQPSCLSSMWRKILRKPDEYVRVLARNLSVESLEKDL
jgi:hypothetical protein